MLAGLSWWCLEHNPTSFLCVCVCMAGAKEIDIAATLEHLRDQRPGMVQTKVTHTWILFVCADFVWFMEQCEQMTFFVFTFKNPA